VQDRPPHRKETDGRASRAKPSNADRFPFNGDLDRFSSNRDRFSATSDRLVVGQFEIRVAVSSPTRGSTP
jgi:hypothetical protein